MIRAVLDTNVLISAVLFGGKPRQILGKAIRGEIRLCISEAILDELKGVLRRPQFAYSFEMVRIILTELTSVSDIVNVSKTIDVVLEDPEDNRTLECAVEAEANYIVTGDSHLLKLSKYRDIEIVDPNAFLKKISSPA